MPSLKNVGFFGGALCATAQTLADVATTVPASADHAVVQVEGQPCRWRDDGVAPTATVGNLLAVGASLTVGAGQFGVFEIIETTTTAKLNVTFYKTG